MKSQIDMLEGDLKLIQTEFKKKNPNVKEVKIQSPSSFNFYFCLQSCDQALKWLELNKPNQGD
jgi:hypothetical protein